MARIALLQMLADGEYHAGPELAAVLGVSRAAIWKQLRGLAELGLVVEAERGRGYRIAGGVDLLDAEAVRSALRTEAAGLLSRLLLLETVDSTNAEALRLLDRGAPAGLVCTAEQQSAGRGRRGRQWVSPYGRNIYMSLGWRYSQGATALEGLSLAVGVAVARALAACGLPPVQLKWPNDLLYRGGKLGGILLEMSGDAAGACQVVVGIGLNVTMPEVAAAHIDQRWTDIAALAGGEPSRLARPGLARPGRSALLAALLNELLPLLAGFEARGFAPWRQAWQALDAFAGVPVVLHSGERRIAGTARGVDDRGALQLETVTGTQTVYGGEITLRPQS
jgi:BirA family biotin operon repressor/biotin-[acetyl-CoA-carboxylase] ligase